MQHQEVVLVEALRSPIGRLGGQLANVRPDDLLAEVVRQVVARSGIDPTLIDQVYAGAANQAGEDNRNVARMATLLAGLPDSVPGVTVNRLCASGLEAVVQGYRQIALSEAQCVVAGGVESMSRAPYVLAKASKAFPVGGLEAQDTCLGWRFKNPKLEAIFPLEAMGCTAENLADDYQISRREQDEFALASQNKAIAAIDAGDFKREIVPIEVAYRKHTETVDTDEGPQRLESRGSQRLARRLSRRRKLAGKRPRSTMAPALMVCSRTFAEAHGLKYATVRSVGSAGVDPTRMGIGPVPASQQALKRPADAGDLDLIGSSLRSPKPCHPSKPTQHASTCAAAPLRSDTP